MVLDDDVSPLTLLERERESFETHGRPRIPNRPRIDYRLPVCYVFRFMKDTYSIAEAQREFPKLSKSKRIVPVTNRGKVQTFIVPVETMLELLETKDVLADAEAMAAVRKHRAKRSNFVGLDAIRD